MVDSQMNLAAKLDALTAAVASNGEAIALLSSISEQNMRALAQAMTALTISLTEIIESEPAQHSSPASEGRAEELYKLSLHQRRSQQIEVSAGQG